MVSLAGRNRRWGSQCSPFYVLFGRVCALGGAGLEPRVATVHSDRDSHCRDFVGVRSGARLSTLLTLLKLLPRPRRTGTRLQPCSGSLSPLQMPQATSPMDWRDRASESIPK